MAKIIVKNKEAFFNFQIEEIFESGIKLSGWEVKSIRAGKVNISGAFCNFKSNELYVTNMHISKYMDVPGDETRARKLLLNKHELKKLRNYLQVKGHTLVATTLKWSNTGYVKLDIALAKGKTLADKRQTIKERDEKRINKKYY